MGEAEENKRKKVGSIRVSDSVLGAIQSVRKDLLAKGVDEKDIPSFATILDGWVKIPGESAASTGENPHPYLGAGPIDQRGVLLSPEQSKLLAKLAIVVSQARQFVKAGEEVLSKPVAQRTTRG